MKMVEKLFKEYIQELHTHLFENEPFEQIIQNLRGSHRRKRFVAMYLIQSHSIFYSYYKRKKELQLDRLFNQIISALLHKKEQNRLKQSFVNRLELHPDMISGKVSSYEIREMEKDLHAFAFYQTKKELKTELE
jgi:hypothetical protein